jgi:hypothetical protein
MNSLQKLKNFVKISPPNREKGKVKIYFKNIRHPFSPLALLDADSKG